MVQCRPHGWREISQGSALSQTKTWVLHLLAVWPWMSCITSIGLTFCSCKLGVIISTVYQFHINVHQTFRMWAHSSGPSTSPYNIYRNKKNVLFLMGKQLVSRSLKTRIWQLGLTVIKWKLCCINNLCPSLLLLEKQHSCVQQIVIYIIFPLWWFITSQVVRVEKKVVIKVSAWWENQCSPESIAAVTSHRSWWKALYT